MANLGLKYVFINTNIKNGQKIPWKVYISYISKCVFYEKKIFVKFFGFLRFFSGSGAWLQNLRLDNDSSVFFWYFDTYVGPGSTFV